MFALIRKDLIACRLFLLIGLVVYLLYGVTTYSRPIIFFLLNIVVAILLFLLPIIVDDRYRIETLVCYLPAPRNHVVLARYVIAGLAIVTGLILLYGGGALLGLFFEKKDFSGLRVPQLVGLFCFLPTVLISLFLPCFFRFGLGKGTFVYAILLIGLSIVLTSPLLMSKAGGEGGFVLTRELLEQPSKLIVAYIDHIAAWIGELRFYVTTGLSTLFLVAISIACSIRFFSQRDV